MNKRTRLILKCLVGCGIIGSGYLGYRWSINPSFAGKLSEADFNDFLSKAKLSENLIENITRIKLSEKEDFLDLLAKDENDGIEVLYTVRERIEDDFMNGRTEQIDGWELSKTEAIVLALAYAEYGEELLQNDSPEGSFETAKLMDFIKIDNWGPQKTFKGVKFNEQPDGHCGLWFQANDVPPNMKVYINGLERRTRLNETGFTSGIDSDIETFINRLGNSEIFVYDDIENRKQKIGVFTVLPQFIYHQYKDGRSSKVFGKISNWGPKRGRLGFPFNEQPNGDSAFWININVSSNQVVVKFNGYFLPTRVQHGRITARADKDLLPFKPGSYPVELVSDEFNETLLVGKISF